MTKKKTNEERKKSDGTAVTQCILWLCGQNYFNPQKINHPTDIVCWDNNGKKIYHLPFDQQYYRTKIELHGEFYAWTVEEAVNAGFRRARRYMFNESI